MKSYETNHCAQERQKWGWKVQKTEKHPCEKLSITPPLPFKRLVCPRGVLGILRGKDGGFSGKSGAETWRVSYNL